MVEILSLFPTPREGVSSTLADGVAMAVTAADSTLHTFENEVATEIWGLADGRLSVGEIVDRIVADFEVERAHAERDVIEFMQLLDERGLLDLQPQARRAH
jgi:coenzyme PQQ synthesis protein D (PqqD)